MRTPAIATALALAATFTLAQPAAASISGVGTVSGTATVGIIAGSCQKGDITDPSGPGLGLPLLTPTTDAHWRLLTSGIGVSTQDGLTLVQIDVCGRLAPVMGIGAACGVSSSHSGIGRMRFTRLAMQAHSRAAMAPIGWTVNLYNVGWPMGVGGTWPITGDYQAAPNGVKTDKFGKVLAVAQAQGGMACLTPQGAQQYSIAGAYSFLPL